jgi:ferritin-like metal-binding protein YciE
MRARLSKGAGSLTHVSADGGGYKSHPAACDCSCGTRLAAHAPSQPRHRITIVEKEIEMPSKKSARSKKESPDVTQLLVLELQEIHSAESQLSRVLPRLTKAVESEKLQAMLDERLKQGERLIQEVESALEEMDESPGRKKNVAAEGLINDAREHVQEVEPGPALDAVLIAAVQKTEHYCVAAWGTSRSLAQAVGQKTVVRSMEHALKEGKTMDEKLTRLAETEITPALMAEGSESEGEEEGDGSMPPRGKKGSGQERRSAT